MKRALLALAACAVISAPASAIDQSGSVAIVADGYAQGEPQFQGWLHGTYSLDARPRPWVFVKLAVLLDADTHGDISRDKLYDETDRDLKRAPLRFRDLALGFHAGETTIVLGRQRLTWKRTSFANPTDNLAPRDWTDPLDEARLSPLAASVAWEHSSYSIEGAVIPRYAPSRLPQLGGRWFDTQGFPVEWGDSTFPAVSWDNLQAAIRGGIHGSRGEARLTYFRGFDDAPRLTLAGTTLTRQFAKMEATGADGELILGAIVLRGEAAYFHFPETGEDGYAVYQVEGEWSRSGWRLIGGFGDSAFGKSGATAPTALDLAYLPAFFLHVEKGDPTEWQAALDATVGTNDFDWLVRLSGSTPLSAHLRAGGELAMINGASTTFWGRWRDNDRLRLFLRCDW